MEINGQANVVKADVEVVIRVKRHTSSWCYLRVRAWPVVSKRGSNAATVAAQL